jgi:cytochrome b5
MLWRAEMGNPSAQTGYDIILNTTGRDATEDFEEVGHSNAAREMLDKYLVGNFEVTL